VRGDVSRLRRPALLLIAGLAGLSYAWALNRDPLEPYYAAAVRSMSMNWHNFIYGAFDPAATLRQLQDDIRTGRFHTVLAAASTDPRLRWIAAHCMNLGNATTTLRGYYCLPQDAARP
jgi:hypothetical protein